MVEVRSLGLPGVVEIKPLKHGDHARLLLRDL